MSRPLKFPSFFHDNDAQAVIRRLLSKNSIERSVNNGFQGIKKMNYFSKLDWENISTGRLEPPYIPKKFRNVNAKDLYKGVKGDQFLTSFYKTQNTKNPTKKKLVADSAEIQIWDSERM